MCEVAVREGDDVGHVGTCNLMSRCECHGKVCERRGTWELERESATETVTNEGQEPSCGRSCFGKRAGFAWRRARGSDRAWHEAAMCAPAGVKPSPETYAVNVADPADGQKLGWINGFRTDGFSKRACV